MRERIRNFQALRVLLHADKGFQRKLCVTTAGILCCNASSWGKSRATGKHTKW